MNDLEISSEISIHRYPGIRPFRKEEEILFFGRNAEIEELLHSIKVHDVFVFFSKSGLGKSSLINAGLIPKLIKEKLFPINIRFLDSSDDPLEKILDAVKNVMPKDILLNIPKGLENNLWVILNIWDSLVTPILVFDQFEEFFYYPTNKKEAVISRLADLVSTKVPISLTEIISKLEWQEGFKKFLEKPRIKFLFALRSDRLSDLDELSEKLPGIFNNRYQLKPLRKEKAEQAIALPALIRERSGRKFKSISYEYSPKSLEIILNTLSNNKDEIESTQLQIVCQEMENIAVKKRESGGENIIEPEDFDAGNGIKKIINKFYESQLTKLRNNKTLLLTNDDLEVIKNLIEKELLSVANKRTIQFAEDVREFLSKVKSDNPQKGNAKKVDAIINELLELRLIREEDSSRGKVYEISHDSLVESIAKARDKRKEDDIKKLNKDLQFKDEFTVDMLSTQTHRQQCYVVMGFGKKTDFETGRTLDLDMSYQNMIKPAVEEAGLQCIRADEIVHSGELDVPMYNQLLTADIVIADLSTSNKNAFYELGVRHALRPFTTLIICEDGMGHLPFDSNFLAVRKYHHLGDDIGSAEARRFSKLLTDVIKSALSKNPRDIDSPVYGYINGLKAPAVTATTVISIADISEKVNASKSGRKDWNNEDQLTHSDLMKQVDEAQKKGDWLTAKSFLLSIRKNLKTQNGDKEDDYILQRLALVIYKSKAPNEMDSLKDAIELLSPLNPTKSNDPETLELWAVVHKRMWDHTNNLNDLNISIKSYERAFYLRDDYYNGLNFAFLLNTRALQISDSYEAIADSVLARRIFKDVIAICKQWIRDNPDPKTEEKAIENGSPYYNHPFWVFSNLAQAYTGLENEVEAEQALKKAYEITSEKWMIEATQNQIDKIRSLLSTSPLKTLKIVQ
ncbi:MAG: tetratricopeptide repeat-containing protein [Ginsengibacter sp.]